MKNSFSERFKITFGIMSAFLIMFGVYGFTQPKNQIKKMDKIKKQYKDYQLHTTLSEYKRHSSSTELDWTVTQCQSLSVDSNGFQTFHKTDDSFYSNANPDKSPHGDKVYKLYVKKYDEYLSNDSTGQSIGQTLVKETWNVRPVTEDDPPFLPRIQSKIDGKLYTPTSVSELFIMYKEDKTAENDLGWVYGSVSLEDKNAVPLLYNDAKLSSCISCHSKTKYDRIFGVKKNE